jgi:hypothetical protein
VREEFFVGRRGSSAVFESLPYDEVGYHRRTSAITGVTTTETGYVRVDNVPMRDGYTYLVILPVVNVVPSAVDNVGRVNIRANASGTATTSSLIIGSCREGNATSASFTNYGPAIGFYRSTADGSLSVLVSIVRQSGAGSVGIFASSTDPFDILVYELGASIADSGTDI